MSEGRHGAVKLLAASDRSISGGRTGDLISMATTTLQRVMGREKITFCSSAELLKKHDKEKEENHLECVLALRRLHTAGGSDEERPMAWDVLVVDELWACCFDEAVQLLTVVCPGDVQHPALGSPCVQCMWLSPISLIWCSG